MQNYRKIDYSKNKYVGKATVKVAFKSPRYSGTKTLTFKINPKGTSLSKVTAKKKTACGVCRLTTRSARFPNVNSF